jgi:hypothetical protein
MIKPEFHFTILALYSELPYRFEGFLIFHYLIYSVCFVYVVPDMVRDESAEPGTQTAVSCQTA